MAQPTHSRVRGEAAHHEHTREFLALITKAARGEGWREHQAFEHWLTAASAALAGPVIAGERWARNEARYMGVVAACKAPGETMALFSQALGVCSMALDRDSADFLGPIFGELSSHAGWGQFFSPWQLCLVMAHMQLQDAAAMLERARDAGRAWISLSEPACGVGGMLLAANQVLGEQGLMIGRDAHWVAVDIDWRAVCGCHIQATLTGASAVVVHGNTLSLEEWEHLPTYAAAAFPKRRTEPTWCEADLFVSAS